MFPFNVFAKRHLQQSEPHVQSLDDVALTGQWMVSTSRLSTRHLTLKYGVNILDEKVVELGYLDCLESNQHLALQSLKSGIQSCSTQFVESSADSPNCRNLLVTHVLQNLHDNLCRQLHKSDVTASLSI